MHRFTAVLAGAVVLAVAMGSAQQSSSERSLQSAQDS